MTITKSRSIEVWTSTNFINNNFCSRDANLAILQIIWNSLDAWADDIKIEIAYDKTWMFLEWLRIYDNWEGMKFEDIENYFGFIGKSWKKAQGQNSKGRYFNGKRGEGRFYAFALWNEVSWKSVYKEDDWGISEFTVVWKIDGDKPRFTISEKIASTKKNTWVEFYVKINNQELIEKISDIEEYLTLALASYLIAYKSHNISIRVNEDKIDIKNAIENYNAPKGIKIYDEDSKKEIDLTIEMFHRKKNWIHKRYINSLHSEILYEDSQTSFKRKNFWHSVNISAEYFEKYKDNNILLVLESPLFKKIEQAVKIEIEKFYYEIKKKSISEQIQQMKEDGIYPYRDMPVSQIEETERAIYDITASEIFSQSSKLVSDTIEGKKLVANLLKQAVESNPDQILPIMRDIVNMSSDDLERFSKLIKEFWIKNIIEISSFVTKRISFIKDIQVLLNNKFYKDNVLERQHLHKILENEAWIFGEWFELWTSDLTLAELLRKHIKLLKRESLELTDEQIKDMKERPDLFLYKKRPGSKKSQFEHLVVELKRPSCVIGFDEINQIKTYASKISEDTMFDTNNTTWKFLLIWNEYKDVIENDFNQRDREKWWLTWWLNYTVHFKTWGELLQDIERQYRTIAERIDQSDTTIETLGYIETEYPEVLSAIHDNFNKKAKKQSNKIRDNIK